jgi:hypothetical protein
MGLVDALPNDLASYPTWIEYLAMPLQTPQNSHRNKAFRALRVNYTSIFKWQILGTHDFMH